MPRRGCDFKLKPEVSPGKSNLGQGQGMGKKRMRMRNQNVARVGSPTTPWEGMEVE
jgi:hypothetical protein